MRIFIPNTGSDIYKGGKGGFLTKLAFALKEKGEKVSGDPKGKYDVSLSPIRLNKVRSRRKILRLDGVYHNNKQNYKNKNLSIKNSLFKSDAIVYQSKFSKKICNTYLGKHKRETIIHNGNFLDFKAEKKIISGFKTKYLTVSKWRPHKRLRDMIESFLFLDDKDSCFYIGGDLKGSGLSFKEIQKYKEKKNIFFLGNINHKQLYSYLEIADCFIHLCWFDNCPNCVVEAISKGVPVVTNNVGGTHEIVSLSGGIVCNIDSPYDFKPCDLYNPPKIDIPLVSKALVDALSVKGKVKNSFLDIYSVADEYLKFFTKVLNGK